MEHDAVRAYPGLRTHTNLGRQCGLYPRKVFEPIVCLVRDDGWRDRLLDGQEVNVAPVGRCENGRPRQEGVQKLSAQHIVQIVEGVQHHEVPPPMLLPPGSILKVVGNGVGAAVEDSHVAAPERPALALRNVLPGEPAVCSIGRRERAANHVQLCRVRIEHTRRVALEALEQPPVYHVLSHVWQPLVVKGVNIRTESGGVEQALDRVGEVVGAFVMEIEAGQVCHVDECRPPGAGYANGRVWGEHAPHVSIQQLAFELRSACEVRSADLVVRKQTDLGALVVVGAVHQLLVGPSVVISWAPRPQR
eukprot:scaffold23835_cov60-Phaeocystis_antarctica.AAC.7